MERNKKLHSDSGKMYIQLEEGWLREKKMKFEKQNISLDITD